jgi:hypothetical protein
MFRFFYKMKSRRIEAPASIANTIGFMVVI